MPSVLVTDPISDDGIALLREGATVDVALGLPPDELEAKLGAYDALVVRSETKVTRAVLGRADKLKVIGRAGMGVDNIDLDAATERGIVVVNAPGGNTVAAAEHTIALLMALARNVGPASSALARGEWKRSAFVGTELRGKTLGVVGFGRIGYEVASIARLGLQMRVVASDPAASALRAAELGVPLLPLEDVLACADVVSLHLPLLPETRGVAGRDFFASMKKGAWFLNVARGALVDETALVDALESGAVGRAGLDVFAAEPPPAGSPLLAHPRVLATPHLGASTEEAQRAVAVDVARQVIRCLAGEIPESAVNLPALDPDERAALAPRAALVRSLAAIAAACADPADSLDLTSPGAIPPASAAYLTALAAGAVLGPLTDERITPVNAGHFALLHGIQVRESRLLDGDRTDAEFRVSCTGGSPATAAGRVVAGMPRLSEIDGCPLDLALGTPLLITRHTDMPGVIASVTGLLAERGANVAAMSVGRNAPHGHAIMVVSLDDEPPSSLASEVAALPAIAGAWVVSPAGA